MRLNLWAYQITQNNVQNNKFSNARIKSINNKIKLLIMLKCDNYKIDSSWSFKKLANSTNIY